MRFNPRKMRKKDIIWLFENKCRAHGMPYIEHPNCFEKEKPETELTERVGFFDIEASNLNASFGYMISYCIKDSESDKIYEACVKPSDIRTGIFDKTVVGKLAKDLRRFNRLVVYWGTDRKFDLPFARTRALFHGADFPLYLEIYATDLYTIVKGKLRLHNGRLQTACDFFGIESKGHRLMPDIWQTAMAGKKASLDYILEHNREDVLSTEALYNKLIPHYRKTQSSL